jgi:hypothetical protein
MIQRERTVAERFEDRDAIGHALREAARDARRFHKAMGNPMATWIDGRVVWVQPEDIQVDVDQLQPSEGEPGSGASSGGEGT